MTTEAETVAKLAVANGAPPKPLLSGEGWASFYLPNPVGVGQILTVDETLRELHPARETGTVTVYAAHSFVEALKVRGGDHTFVAYADDERRTLTVVLDDDEHGKPGWRDYRLVLALRRTPEWEEWISGSNRAMGQGAFAEMLEDRASMISEPEPATMLEIAQTLVGHQGVQWASGSRLKDGSRQLRWTESIEAKAGDAGTMEIPSSFTIELPLFRGGDVAYVKAMFRFRLNGGALTLHYKLLDVDRLEREAFDSMLEGVRTYTGAPTILLGPAPAATA